MRCSYLGVCGLAAAFLLMASQAVQAQSLHGRLISEQSARRVGLHRAWAARVSVDGTRDRIQSMRLQDGLLLVQSKTGVIHVLDAETGRTLWANRFGKPREVCAPPGANHEFVCIVHGQRLFQVFRENGDVQQVVDLDGLPSTGGVIMGKVYAYVPMLLGGVRAFPLHDLDQDGEPRRPWRYSSGGKILRGPVLSDSSVAWTTSRGHLIACDKLKVNVHFRFQAGTDILAPLGVKSPMLYVAANDRYLYAVDEQTGITHWRYPTGDLVVEAPLPIGDRVYAVRQLGGLHCVEAEEGVPIWTVDRVTSIVAASPTRLYATDSHGNLLILSAATGAQLASLDTYGHTVKTRNATNDRIYLATDTGLVQCLHERQLIEPAIHNLPPGEDEPAGKKPADPPAGDKPADPANPFGGGKPADGGNKPADPANPFGGGNKPADGDKPANPFGAAGGNNPFK